MSSTPSHRPWLLHTPDPDAPARLFCFPYSGCGASMYGAWPRSIAVVDVCLVQTPARENRIREPHYGTIEALADQVADGLVPFLDRPFMFFGHCAGVLQAYETCLRLAERGIAQPSHLFLSSQPPPDSDHASTGFPAMTEPQLRAEIWRLARRHGGEPTEGMVDLAMRVYAPDLDAVRRYRKAAPVQLEVPITVVAWRDSGRPVADLVGWSAYGRTDLVELSGDHYDFLDAPARLTDLIAARSPVHASIERALTGLWAELFEVAPVRPDLDFFEAGGNSAIAVRLKERIDELFDVDLELLTIFEYPTVAELATRISAARNGADGGRR